MPMRSCCHGTRSTPDQQSAAKSCCEYSIYFCVCVGWVAREKGIDSKMSTLLLNKLGTGCVFLSRSCQCVALLFLFVARAHLTSTSSAPAACFRRMCLGPWARAAQDERQSGCDAIWIYLARARRSVIIKSCENTYIQIGVCTLATHAHIQTRNQSLRFTPRARKRTTFFRFLQ